MGLLIQKTDFIGKYKVGGTNFDEADKYIQRYEENALRNLLGVALFDLFKAAKIADSTLVATPKYKTIYDPLIYDDASCKAVVQNNGMKQMVLGLVWFEFVRDTLVKMTNAGPKRDKAEVSDDADPSFVYQRYNESVNDWQVIQRYIKNNLSTYPEFNGQHLGIAHWAL